MNWVRVWKLNPQPVYPVLFSLMTLGLCSPDGDDTARVVELKWRWWHDDKETCRGGLLARSDEIYDVRFSRWRWLHDDEEIWWWRSASDEEIWRWRHDDDKAWRLAALVVDQWRGEGEDGGKSSSRISAQHRRWGKKTRSAVDVSSGMTLWRREGATRFRRWRGWLRSEGDGVVTRRERWQVREEQYSSFFSFFLLFLF